MPPIKNKRKSADLVHYFFVEACSPFYRFLFTISFYFIFPFRGGGLGPRGLPLDTSLHSDIFGKLEISLPEYLKMWNRISLQAFIVDLLNATSEFCSALQPPSNYISPMLSHLRQKLSFA